MTDIIVEQHIDPPVTEAEVASRRPEVCLALHRVRWRGGLLSLDGRRLVCRFVAPDTEAVRIALRHAGESVEALWPATRIAGTGSGRSSNHVIAAYRFDDPADPATLHAITRAGGWYTQIQHVIFDGAFVSRDRRRMLCLYQAADAASVWCALRHSDIAVDAVWAFRSVCAGSGPDSVRPPPRVARHAPV